MMNFKRIRVFFNHLSDAPAVALKNPHFSHTVDIENIYFEMERLETHRFNLTSCIFTLDPCVKYGKFWYFENFKPSSPFFSYSLSH